MNLYLVGLLVGSLFYIICYLALNDFVLAAIPAVLAIAYFSFFAQPQIKKMNGVIKSFRNSYQFINNFVVALSIQPVVDTSFSHALSSLDAGFQERVGDMGSLNGIEKVKYMSNFFQFHSYQLFVDIINLWQEHGGDVLKMTTFLMNEIRESDEYITVCERMHTKKTVEFTILWIFSLVIIGVLRFALSQFYLSICDAVFFKIGILSIFVFALFSCQLLISKMTKLDIKGWDKHGK